MTKQVQRRRGTATQHTSFTGAEGELSVNTTNKSVHVHDNVTAGGFEAARADMDNVTSSSILTAAGITATTTELNYVDGVTSSIQTQLDGKAGTASPTFTGTLTTANLTATGTTTLAGASTSADITFGDNDKAIFGAGSDLQIYHDSASGQSIIQENGPSVLKIRATDFRISNAANTADYLSANNGAEVSIRYNGAVKLATTNTGVDITGTLTSDDVSIADTSPTLLFNRTDRATDNKIIRFAHDGEDFQLQLANDAVSSVTPAIAINRTGMSLDSIAFYEDTGTTPKFFWDASAEYLGLGTTTPDTNLHVYHATRNNVAVFESGDADVSVYLRDGNSTSISAVGIGASTDDLTFRSGNAERMRIDASGNVGIGTSSPTRQLDVSKAGTAYIRASDTSSSVNMEMLAASSGGWVGTQTNHSLNFQTNNTERMRIDSSGNLLVGKTSTSLADAGARILPTGQVYSTASGVAPFAANRLSSDGAIMELYKDTGLVGSIGVSGGNNIYISGEATNHAGLTFATQSVLPTTEGTINNNTVDLGQNGNAFKDLYLSGGVYLGGTGAANKLDDYEEGTWTGALDFFSGSTGSLAYTTNTLRYVKIGNQVSIFGAIGWSANNFSASNGSLCLTGLPFTGTNNNARRGGVNIHYAETPWLNLTIYQQTFREEVSETKMTFNFTTGTNGNLTGTTSDYTNIDSTGTLFISGSYFTD
jgi:hypothetical protein